MQKIVILNDSRASNARRSLHASPEENLMENNAPSQSKPPAKRSLGWRWKLAIIAVVFLLGIGSYVATLQSNDQAIVDELRSRKIFVIGGTLLDRSYGRSVAPKLPERYGPFLFFAQGIVASKRHESLEVRENDLLLMSKLKNVTQVDFWEIKVSDKGLSHLAALPHLERITFYKTETTDAGALELAEVQNLRHLRFHDVPIGDAGVRHLAKLSHLTVLVLSNTKVTDQGLQALQGFPNLDALDLSKTPITDEGLMHLLKCKKLKWLDLNGTQCTQAGIQKFKNAHPNRELFTY